MKKKKVRRRSARRSNKSALIKGASKPLPRELLDEPTFREGLQVIMRGYSGLYVLYQRNKLYYIGLAKDLFWRLHRHTRNKHKNKWDRFAIYRINRVRYLKDIESMLLLIAHPPGNAVSGKFHRDADLTKVLQKIQRQQSKMLNRVQKALN